MNADKIAAKMAVYYKKYEKIFTETGKLQGFAYKMLILLILEIQYRCNIQVMLFMHNLEFVIFKMASKMDADKFYKPVGAEPYLYACLMDL